MLITLILISIVIIGIVAELLYEFTDLDRDWLDAIGFLFTRIGGCLLFLALTVIFFTHINIDHNVKQEQIEYDGLCKQIEVLQSNYEDASIVTVIKEVTEWNKAVEGYRYWNNNIWTAWFLPNRYVNSLKTIDISNIKK